MTQSLKSQAEIFNPQELVHAHAQARQRALPFIDFLAQLHAQQPREVARSVAQAFGLPFWTSTELAQAQSRFDLWPFTRAQQSKSLLLQANAQLHNKLLSENHTLGQTTLIALVCDPFDTDLLLQLEHAAGAAIVCVLCSPEDIHAYIHQHEADTRAVENFSTALDPSVDLNGSIEVLSLAHLAQTASPAVKLVNSTLYDALRMSASDVHLETTATGLTVKYRIDGVLDEITQVQGRAFAEQTISRLKVLSELDIAERRIPQDGSFQVLAQERLIDLRVSIMPSIHGEDAVIRILDKQSMIEAHGKLSLDALGFSPVDLAALRELMELAHGMLLVTGPTGSGKTTTLYAALAESQTGQEKIITIEDPVEYQLPGVLQIPVHDKKGLTFARGLRSILRHDPDKIMVGEIRDHETAEIAVQAALTGHLVLSTVHANNVFDVFGRFTHMGLDPYALVSSLNGIWAQRLLRMNCPHCLAAYEPKAHDVQRCGIAQHELAQYNFQRGTGCGYCRGSGYKGRKAIAEFLVLDDELRELIVQRQPMRQIKETAKRKGSRTLLDAALTLVAQGQTTLEEVKRVTLST